MTNVYWLTRLITKSFLNTILSVEVIHPEKKIEKGGAIIAVNHASFLDPPLLGGVYDNPLAYLARNTLFKGFLSWLLPAINSYPIDRDQADLKSMRTIFRVLKNGERLVMFPEGTRSHDGNLLPAKAGIGMLVAKSRVPVQPVRIFGSFEAFPRSGGMRRGRIKVIIGDPVEFTKEELAIKTRDGYQKIADRLMEEIAKLG